MLNDTLLVPPSFTIPPRARARARSRNRNRDAQPRIRIQNVHSLFPPDGIAKQCHAPASDASPRTRPAGYFRVAKQRHACIQGWISTTWRDVSSTSIATLSTSTIVGTKDRTRESRHGAVRANLAIICVSIPVPGCRFATSASGSNARCLRWS
jgi:hypothetical protein